MKLKLLFLSLWCLCAHPTTQAANAVAPKGIALVKMYAHSSPTDVADVVPYTSYSMGPVYWSFHQLSSAPQQVRKELILGAIDIPSPNEYPQLITSEDVLPLVEKAGQLDRLIREQPKTKKWLAPSLALLQSEIAQYNGGKKKLSGCWLTSTEYQERVRVAEVEAQRQQKAAEQKRQEQEQKSRAVAESQRNALQKYPDLKVEGSSFNRAFVAAVTAAKTSRPSLLEQTDWPMVIADEVGEKEKTQTPELPNSTENTADGSKVDHLDSEKAAPAELRATAVAISVFIRDGVGFTKFHNEAAHRKVRSYMDMINNTYGKDADAGWARMNADADEDKAEALYIVGWMMMNQAVEMGSKPEHIKVGMQKIRRAAELGHVPSLLVLAAAYSEGVPWVSHRDLQEASMWMDKAKQHGH